jgi:hypothetical protein
MNSLMTINAHDLRTGLLLAALTFLASCTLKLSNTQPAREISAPLPVDGDLYAGWRVFHGKCSSCHGVAATGGDQGPDLLPLIREMNARQFAELVLKRYDLGSGATQGAKEQSTVETRIEEIMRRGEVPVEMPAWQSEPVVNAHIIDLYAYLSARADGKLDVGRPPPR